jgi:hypothetical protein
MLFIATCIHHFGGTNLVPVIAVRLPCRQRGNSANRLLTSATTSEIGITASTCLGKSNPTASDPEDSWLKTPPDRFCHHDIDGFLRLFGIRIDILSLPQSRLLQFLP